MLSGSSILIGQLKDFVKDGALISSSPNYMILHDGHHAYAYLPNGKSNKDKIKLTVI